MENTDKILDTIHAVATNKRLETSTIVYKTKDGGEISISTKAKYNQWPKFALEIAWLVLVGCLVACIVLKVW